MRACARALMDAKLKLSYLYFNCEPGAATEAHIIGRMEAAAFSILSTASTEKSTYWQLQFEKCGCSHTRDTVICSWHVVPIQSRRR